MRDDSGIRRRISLGECRGISILPVSKSNSRNTSTQLRALTIVSASRTCNANSAQERLNVTKLCRGQVRPPESSRRQAEQSRCNGTRNSWIATRLAIFARTNSGSRCLLVLLSSDYCSLVHEQSARHKNACFVAGPAVWPPERPFRAVVAICKLGLIPGKRTPGDEWNPSAPHTGIPDQAWNFLSYAGGARHACTTSRLVLLCPSIRQRLRAFHKGHLPRIVLAPFLTTSCLRGTLLPILVNRASTAPAHCDFGVLGTSNIQPMILVGPITIS